MSEWGLQRSFKPMTASAPDLDAWYEDTDFTEQEKLDGLAGCYQWLLRDYGRHAVLRRTPAGTGMALLEMTLPLTDAGKPISYPALPEGIAKLIHATAFPHRWQEFGGVPVVEYDARSAWVACCRDVPVYRGELLHDDKDEYVPYMPGRYLVDVTVPKGWAHIGLVPAEHVSGERQRAYPNKPGDNWRVWLDGMEVALLVAEGWSFKIETRLLFPQSKIRPGADPLRAWIMPFLVMLERIERHPFWPAADIKAIRHCIRAIAIQTIGRFHAVGGQEYTEINPDTGKLSLRVAPQHNSYTRRFHMPHVFSAIVTKARVRVTRQALGVPLANIVAIHGDSLILSHDPAWLDSGKVGAYRRKVAQHA